MSIWDMILISQWPNYKATYIGKDRRRANITRRHRQSEFINSLNKAVSDGAKLSGLKI